jgi:AcrR family transcriptional regulator
MDEIAKDLQISKKTIYKCYKTKEKLVEEVCKFDFKNINDGIDKIINSKDNVILKYVKILNLYGNHIVHISERWIHDLKIHTPKIWHEIEKERLEKTKKILKLLINEGKKEKLVENYPDEIIITAFISTISAIIAPEFIMNSKVSMNEAFKNTFEILLNGIFTEKGKIKFKKEKDKIYKNSIININL